LGYEFNGLESPNGHKLHLDTSKYNKKKMARSVLTEANQEKPQTFSISMIFYSVCFVQTSLQAVATMIQFEVVLCIPYTMPILSMKKEMNVKKDIDVMPY
jgi:hypothetical protein